MIGTEVEITVGELLLFIGATTLVLFLIRRAILKIVWGRKNKKAADFLTTVVVASNYAEIFIKGFGEMGFRVVPKGINQDGDQCVEIDTKEFNKECIEFLIELKVLKKISKEKISEIFEKNMRER